MSKHTPGPWNWENYNGIIHVFLENTFGTPSVCKLIGENQEDNARLIAAAPELLDALDALINAPWSGTNVDKARAAIAKAKGGAA